MANSQLNLCIIHSLKEGKQVKTMRDIHVGQNTKVVKIHGEGALKRRIMDMGITKGTEVKLVKVAPLGDPMELELRGYHLSLRKADADLVEVM